MSAWHCKIQKQTVRRPDGIVFRGMPNPTGTKMSRAGRLPVLSCGFLQIQVLYSKAFGKTWQRKRLEIHIWTIYFSSTEARLFFGKDRNVLRSDRKAALFHNTGYNIPLFHLQERWSKGWKNKEVRSMQTGCWKIRESNKRGIRSTNSHTNVIPWRTS